MAKGCKVNYQLFVFEKLKMMTKEKIKKISAVFAFLFMVAMSLAPVSAFGQVATSSPYRGGYGYGYGGGQGRGGQNNQPACTVFRRNLNVGSSGGDVVKLKEILKNQGATENVGSGNYYNEATASAVSGLQEKYASQILAPYGFAHGTGYVGPRTRDLLNRISCAGGSTQSTTSTSTAPMVSGINPSVGLLNTAVTLTGNGFLTSGNGVNFGAGFISNISSPDGKTLIFQVPTALNPRCYYSTPRCATPSTQTKEGNYSVSVVNTNGTSNAVNFKVQFNYGY